MLYDLNPLTWELNAPPETIPAQSRVVIVRGQDVLSTQADHWQPPQLVDMGLAEEPIWLGYVEARPYYAVQWPEEVIAPQGHYWIPLRDLLLLSEQAFAVASRAAQLVTWLRQHQYCGQCGRQTRRAYEEHYLACDPCRLRFYPRIHPCIIVLVTRGDEVLLAQGVRQQKSGYYSTLAGFMEVGESVEQAVHREVFEEVGLRITNLRYINSQTWPFPNQLMLGFLADYADGEFVLEPTEIVDARWWPLDNLPKRPPSGSISGYLVDTYKRERGYL
ncbi:NAD(+) diphosphatase [Salinispirillum marinum]|uniref:NAD(+) diphosphatase n=2 Tax=Saccharospirillaceae TaxID=255527 RepID=A0ABV8BI78_9GAMM